MSNVLVFKSVWMCVEVNKANMHWLYFQESQDQAEAKHQKAVQSTDELECFLYAFQDWQKSTKNPI